MRDYVVTPASAVDVRRPDGSIDQQPVQALLAASFPSSMYLGSVATYVRTGGVSTRLRESLRSPAA